MYPTVQTVTDNTIKHNYTNVPYNSPGFVAVDNVIKSLNTLIRIHY